MLFETNDIAVRGATVCGKTLDVEDDTSLIAVYDRENVSVGVLYETNGSRPRLRFCPAIQVPEVARDGFNHFIFDFTDETNRITKLRMDSDDGELTMDVDVYATGDGLAPALEETIGEYLEFIDKVLYPEVIDYVAGQLE